MVDFPFVHPLDEQTLPPVDVLLQAQVYQFSNLIASSFRFGAELTYLARFTYEINIEVEQTLGMSEIFSNIAEKVSEYIGSPWAFTIAIGAVFLWLISGPFLGFSDTWQLIINTSTTIITFLTVFLIQHTQNKNDRATQLKLDELLHSIKEARNDFIDLEDMDEKKLKRLREKYKKYKDRG